MNGPKKFLLLVLSAVICCACLAQVSAQEKPADKIVFLHIKYKDGAFTLIDASVRPGTLKTPPRSKGDIHIEMVSTQGQPLWNTLIEDPSIQRYEYEDPDRPGQFKRIERKLVETEFVLRVPFHGKAKQVILSRKKPENVGGAAAKTAREILGALDIPALKGAE